MSIKFLDGEKISRKQFLRVSVLSLIALLFWSPFSSAEGSGHDGGDSYGARGYGQ